MLHELSGVVAAFDVQGTLTSVSAFNNGHINNTFKITLDVDGVTQHYILQCINHDVFKSPLRVIENMVRVTEHIRSKLLAAGTNEGDRQVLQLQKLRGSEQSCFKCTNENYWRLYAFVDGAKTIETDQTCTHIYEAAKGYGRFLGQLSDLPSPPLHEIIPNFHNGVLRYEALAKAIQLNAVGRASTAKNEIDFIQRNQPLLEAPQNLIDTKAVPLRPTHNDTKISNVLLDDATDQAVCVIDLDTVMPGLAMYDFGDLVRTTVTGKAEDEPDLSKIIAQPERFEAAQKGFLSGAASQISEAEVESLKQGPAFMALIMATRFLTDYLQGDTYYKTQHSEHNLQRTRAQIQLVKSLQRL